MPPGLPGLPPPGFATKGKGLPGLPPPGFATKQTSFVDDIPAIGGRVAQGGLDLVNLLESASRNLNPTQMGGPRLFGLNENIYNSESPELLQRANQAVADMPEPQTGVGKIVGEIGYYAPSVFIPGGSLAARAASVFGAGTAAGTAKAIGAGETGQAVAGLVGGLTPAGVGSAFNRGRSVLESGGKALRRKAIGTRSTDYAKTAKEIGVWDIVDDDVASETMRVIDDLQAQGVLGKSVDPSKMVARATRVESELNKQVASIIDNFDELAKRPLGATFPRAERYIDAGNIRADELQRYRNQLSNLKEGIATEGKGKLRYLQNQKIAWGGKYEKGDDAANGFFRSVYNDLKDSIENVVPEVGPLNKEVGKLKLIKPILQRNLGGDEAKDLISSTIQALRTSGGTLTNSTMIGALAGGGAGGPIGLALGAGLGLASSAPGRNLIGKGMINAGTAIPQTLGTIRSSAPRAAIQGASRLEGLQRPNQGTSLSDVQNADAALPGSQQSAIGNTLPIRRPQQSSIQSSSIPSPNPAQSYDETQAVFNRISGVDMRNPETPEDVELIIDAIKQVESSGGKFTTGPKTKYGVAKGSYQVLDTTGQEYHQKLGIDEPYDPYNEEQQREIVRAILGDYMRMFDGDIGLALTAYHTGPGNVRKGKIGPQGRAYLPKIEKAIEELVRQA